MSFKTEVIEAEAAGGSLEISCQSFGLRIGRRAMILAVGIASRSISKSLAPTSTLRMVAPVKLPPGWFRLATKPICTGSLVVVKTIGMVAVAAFAALAAGVEQATIRAT